MAVSRCRLRMAYSITGSVVTVVACQGLTWAGDGCPAPAHADPTSSYTRAATQLTMAPFMTQALNGRVRDQTLWNYHFEEGSAILHPSGLALLDRLVRQSSGCPLDIYIQTPRDVPYRPGAAHQYLAEREALTAQRVQAVADYLSANRPDVAYQIHVNDLGPRSMAGVEAVGAMEAMQQRAPQGFLPYDVLGGLVISPRSLLYRYWRGMSLSNQTSTSGSSTTNGSSSSQSSTSGP